MKCCKRRAIPLCILDIQHAARTTKQLSYRGISYKTQAPGEVGVCVVVARVVCGVEKAQMGTLHTFPESTWVTRSFASLETDPGAGEVDV